MSRKRFIVESVMIDCLCEDEPRIAKVITDTDETYSYEDLYEVAELLNEQQATITELESDKAIAEDYANIFEKENVKLRKKLNEQQDIIFKLQDLCGKSDYENAQLRQKVKELQDKIDMLCEKYDYPKSGEK